MFIDEIKGTSVDQVISYFGQNPNTKDRTFLMFREEDDAIRNVSYGEYYNKSIDYAKIIHALRQ